jgi:hypothetical protein
MRRDVPILHFLVSIPSAAHRAAPATGRIFTPPARRAATAEVMRVNIFSRHWKRKPENFQALEFFTRIFPRLGKRAAARYESGRMTVTQHKFLAAGVLLDLSRKK